VAALVHTADKIWILGPAAAKLAPTELSVIVGKVVNATNRYHTSAEFEFPQTAAGTEPAALAVAFNNVPAVLLQVMVWVITVPPEHKLLAGWANECSTDNKINVKERARLLVWGLIIIGFFKIMDINFCLTTSCSMDITLIRIVIN
jgi:hypothetical protein